VLAANADRTCILGYQWQIVADEWE